MGVPTVPWIMWCWLRGVLQLRPLPQEGEAPAANIHPLAGVHTGCKDRAHQLIADRPTTFVQHAPSTLLNVSNALLVAVILLQAGLEPTHQIVKLARDANFSNVHDYLVHLVTGERDMHPYAAGAVGMPYSKHFCLGPIVTTCSNGVLLLTSLLSLGVWLAGESAEKVSARKDTFWWGSWLKAGSSSGADNSDASAQTADELADAVDDEGEEEQAEEQVPVAKAKRGKVRG